MRNKILISILFSFVVACSNPLTVNAKPSAPVKIEYSVPKNIQIGDEVTTTIQFSAKINLQRLIVNATSYSGLELISGGNRVEFTNLQSGSIQKIDFKIRLTDEVGYLSVFATTIDSRGNTQSKSIAVRYGKVSEVKAQKILPQGIVEDSSGEKLIIMQGEARE